MIGLLRAVKEGTRVTVRHTVMDSPLGELTLVAEGGALVGLYFDKHRHQPRPAAWGERVDDGFERATSQLREYFARQRTEFDLELAPEGTDFEQRVWTLLRAIPYGRTRSYGDLASDLGDPGLARAVGTANGRNPISVIVPCHRVIGADGSLTGYGGGLDRKRFLLRLEEPEAADAGRLF
jgi:methylated-DNA-[protein]-cysteine S-methyltransferase